MDSLLKGDVFKTSEIIILILNIIIIFLVITLYLHINSSDCRGQIITKSKTSKGEIHSREAKLSIHDGHGMTEIEPLKYISIIRKFLKSLIINMKKTNFKCMYLLDDFLYNKVLKDNQNPPIGQTSITKNSENIPN